VTATSLRPPGGWIQQAACYGTNPQLFFPEDKGHGTYDAAKAICSQCPVRQACLDYAINTFDAHHDWGMWGGTTPRERRDIRRAK
jgi:WhiB family transcriptional regulator, redox-sensing transcriptional regulator